ncbi:MAG TPA: hypothetical protein ENI87_04515 [bacterium]|nr:hypothetical protein [bacterium]
MHAGIAALWSVLEACRAGKEVERDEAAVGAAECLGRRPLALTIENARLLVDGVATVGGVDDFAAMYGLRAFLCDAGVAHVQFAAGCRARALCEWAAHIVAGTRPPAWPEGVEVELQDDGGGDDLPSTPLQRCRALPEAGDSLRSVFMQHRLIAELPEIPGVAPEHAKRIVQGIVERLLRTDGGLEPLMRLQQEGARLRRCTAVAVLTVLFARRIGWPPERLADLGIAGLLHDLGSVLERERPDAAAFVWLLERGDDDFWLRNALTARRWRDGEGAVRDDSGPLASVTLVRAAVAAQREGAAGIERLVRAGEVPPDVGELAQRALAPGYS